MRLEKHAQSQGLAPQILNENAFELVLYSRYELDKIKKHQILNIYLEGDGRPWIQGSSPAANPTSRSRLAFKLMLQDSAASIYLNRPCYALGVMPENCDSSLWTNARYSEMVVDTLNKALSTIKTRTEAEGFTLIGHSGGGTLALLLAARRNDVHKLITVAANVDHQAWTESNNYLPLDRSLNAINYLPLNKYIEQRHFIGEKDQVISSQITIEALKRDTNAKIILIKDFDHQCCWKKHWQEHLGQAKTQ